jgi:XTP/dITP diphosphohydrolase
MPGSNSSVFFATGNEGKVLEARIILEPFGIRVKPFSGKGVEIQADIERVASFSAKEAARKYHRSLVVEDAGLYVEAMSGFPGAFSSFVFKTVGIPGLLALLDGRPRKAAFRSAVAYCEPGGRPRIFKGQVTGTIRRTPVGENGFGFDPVFVPDGQRKTLGELTMEEKCAISHRGHAMRKFAAWYSRR